MTGQKGVGLLLVVMMAFMPTQFALNTHVSPAQLKEAAGNIERALLQESTTASNPAALQGFASETRQLMGTIDTLNLQSKTALLALRKGIQKLNGSLNGAISGGLIADKTTKETLRSEIKHLEGSYEFAPLWMIALISICLGIGTMIGWKRIVITIGEKIGKSHLTYAQGASAELCAAATIGVSTGLGLPVSTTHVLLSGIAGTMVAQGGVKNLQKGTIRNIALAWLLTLPVSFALAFVLFFALRTII